MIDEQRLRFHTIAANETYSKEVLAEARTAVADFELPGVHTVALAGSLGRLEASRSSDADFIIVLGGGAESADIATVVERLGAYFVERGLDKPNPSGVFANPRSLDELLPPKQDGGIGQPDETVDVLGKRMLLLLESTPLWNEAGYHEVVDQIFGRYSAYVTSDPTKEHVYLMNDLIRYFRYICVNYQSTFGAENEKWALRNVKLRHSRLLMYFGLLALLGNASRYQDGRAVSEVKDHLSDTPLQRVAYAYSEAGDFSYPRFAGLYNNFLTAISDPSLRDQLNSIDYEDRYRNPTFSSLKANSDAFQAELTRFVFARRGLWSDRFFDYLLF